MLVLMKALVKKIAGKGLWLEEKPMPKISPKDVLVKVLKTAICGTDVHIYSWDDWASRTIQTPLIIGHEFVGVIVEVGDEVRGLKVGERVSAEGHLICGQCRACQAGKRHLCPNTQGIGIHRDGCFAEYIAVPATNIWKIYKDVPDEIAAIYDPLGNATHCALSFDMIGEDVLITGAGPIGCMAAAICRHNGARNIVATDVNEYRLNLATMMGADRIVQVHKEDLRKVMAELDMVGGFDIGLEMSGSTAALSQMLDTMYNGGRIALLGLLPKNTAIDWDMVIFKGLIIKGIYGREIFETWYKLEAMLRSGLNVSSIITHRFNFEDFQKGFDAMLSGMSGKVILSME